jgi:hypothetical protein
MLVGGMRDDGAILPSGSSRVFFSTPLNNNKNRREERESVCVTAQYFTLLSNPAEHRLI